MATSAPEYIFKAIDTVQERHAPKPVFFFDPCLPINGTSHQFFERVH
jgi:hypothetical protein